MTAKRTAWCLWAALAFGAAGAGRSGSWEVRIDPCGSYPAGRPEAVGYRLLTTRPVRQWRQTTTYPVRVTDEGAEAVIGTGPAPLRRNVYLQARCLGPAGELLGASYLTRIYLGTGSTIYEEFDR